MSKKEGFWKAYYVCSICGEQSSYNHVECPFCHSHMRNHERVIESPEKKNQLEFVCINEIELCKYRNEDRCSDYCEGYDTLCERYRPAKDGERYGKVY